MTSVKVLFLTSILTLSISTHGKIIFPYNDQLQEQKEEAIKLINEYMNKASAVKYIQQSEGVLLWANEAYVIPSFDFDNDNTEYQQTSLPSFTPATNQNQQHLRSEIEKQCQCSTSGRDIIGILIASPIQAAKMFYRAGWLNYQGDELEGIVPPLVIIYHEFAHAKDFWLHPEYFFDMATLPSAQWMNEAEKSAVMQQNDLVQAIYLNTGLLFSRRSSYGRNELFKVEGPLDIE